MFLEGGSFILEPFNHRRISDISFVIDNELNVHEGNRSFLKLFNITDPHLNFSDFISESDSDNFKCFLKNFSSSLKKNGFIENQYFIASIFPTKEKDKGVDSTFKSCLFYIEEKGENKFNVDVKELSYSKKLLDKALLESREYTALLQNFDAYYFVYDGNEFTLKSTRDSVIIFKGNFWQFKEYFSNSLKIDKDSKDSNFQFDSMISDCQKFVANKIYKFLQSDKKLVTVHTSKTSIRNRSIIIGSISKGEERRLVQNLYSETKDGLTDLYNKKAITELAIQKVNDSKNPVTLIIMDVDKFKEFNDTYGHAFGDKVLVAVSQCIKESISGIGIAGRIGGDEFLIILDKTDEEDVRNITRNIRIGIQWSITATDPSNVVTCSMGIARFPLNAKNYDELFKIADKCLYIAKNKGRNCYVIYKPELHDSVIVANEKNLNSLAIGTYFQESAQMEYGILSCIMTSNNDSLKLAIKKLVDYMQINKITIYDKNYEIVFEFEKLYDKKQLSHGDIRKKYLENENEYFKYFNEFNFLHMDNTEVLNTLDKTKYYMYKDNSIASILEVKLENIFICFDLYKPARTFPKEKIIFALLASKLISEKI